MRCNTSLAGNDFKINANNIQFDMLNKKAAAAFSLIQISESRLFMYCVDAECARTYPWDDELSSEVLDFSFDFAADVELVAVQGDSLQVSQQVLLTCWIGTLQHSQKGRKTFRFGTVPIFKQNQAPASHCKTIAHCMIGVNRLTLMWVEWSRNTARVMTQA